MSNSRRYEAKPGILRSGTPVDAWVDDAWPLSQGRWSSLADPERAEPDASAAPPIVFVIEGDTREEMNLLLESDGITVRSHATCEDFLAAYRPGRSGCLLLDAGVPGMGCLELIRRLADRNHQLPVVMMTGDQDVSIVVKAMKAGVLEFVEKPVQPPELLAAVRRVLQQSRDAGKLMARHQAAERRIATLTPRQREVLSMILDGALNKNIAADLGVSQRTVESHRAAIMRKTGSHSLPELARLAIAAGASGDPASQQQADPSSRH